MKKYILLFSLCLIAFGACDNGDEELESLPLVAITNDAIIGEWQLVEAKIGDGGSALTWEHVKNSYTIEFLGDGSFKRTAGDCNTGTYQVVKNPYRDDTNMIELSYDCELDQNKYPDNKSYWGIELLNDDYLIYSPTYKGSICIDGCFYKFQKL